MMTKIRFGREIHLWARSFLNNLKAFVKKNRFTCICSSKHPDMSFCHALYFFSSIL